MIYQRKKFLIWLLLTIICMAFIFYKSSQPYYEQDLRPSLSAHLPDKLVQILPDVDFYYGDQLVTSKQPYDFIEFFIRKGAHVSIFAVLTLLSIQTLLALKWGRASAIAGGATITLLYAMSDEWHQTFVVNRTGQAIDVGIDSIGIVLVVLCYVIVGAIIHHRHRRNRPYTRF
ncbi:VanZ family protein [Paenibacillus sp. D2_2]|uniref:VanZ family protein n=1 Tax=Paenibacillus sp. D2_2 TaxID=3073092 RepID=UPI0028153037|nr:VanZ family protein [Paenibacillus sp. D2_2]WMT42160.1 VanZ family protein [Paenibacillus sp. D2_2]